MPTSKVTRRVVAPAVMVASPDFTVQRYVTGLWAGTLAVSPVSLWAAVSGACSGSFMGVLFAEVSAHVEDRQRGRALGWVMSGQSLTLVLGVPLAAAHPYLVSVFSSFDVDAVGRACGRTQKASNALLKAILVAL